MLHVNYWICELYVKKIVLNLLDPKKHFEQQKKILKIQLNICIRKISFLKISRKFLLCLSLASKMHSILFFHVIITLLCIITRIGNCQNLQF